MSDTTEKTAILLPLEIGPKGKQTISIDSDEFEMDETGTKDKNGKPVTYYKFKLIVDKFATGVGLLTHKEVLKE